MRAVLRWVMGIALLPGLCFGQVAASELDTALDQPPPPEIGLMVTETIFGSVAAAATSLIPYYLVLRNDSIFPQRPGGESIQNLIFVLIFAAVPLAVSQAEFQQAEKSKYYIPESWPPPLAGLLAQGAVVGLFAIANQGLETAFINGGAEALLLIGTIAFVPLVEMAAINLFKTPKTPAPRFMPPVPSGKTFEASVLPIPFPVLGTSQRQGTGIGFSLLRGRF